MSPQPMIFQQSKEVIAYSLFFTCFLEFTINTEEKNGYLHMQVKVIQPMIQALQPWKAGI